MANMFGTSFSVKYSRELGIDSHECLQSALKDLQFRNLRLMSYWDLHEPKEAVYDFKDLDWQFELAKNYKAKISLTLGLRQPRWPESHWPNWAKQKPSDQWQQHLFNYIETVVNRYKNHPSLDSWQLENEAMLKTFGENGDFDHERLKFELALVKSLDSRHEVLMSTSDSWGLPWRGPIPDKFGFSVYRYFYDRGKYRKSRKPPIFYKTRAFIIRVLTSKRSFIHELQAEPWGPKATHLMNLKEQFITMNPHHLKEAVKLASKSNLLPAYFWGLEWWYWLKTTQDYPDMWEAVKKLNIKV